MLVRLQEQGYTGSLSLLKAHVHSLRPHKVGHQPVQRYETKPGEQMQFDWGEFHYEKDGSPRKLYGFTAILGYSPLSLTLFCPRMTVEHTTTNSMFYLLRWIGWIEIFNAFIL
jgi:transposase